MKDIYLTLSALLALVGCSDGLPSTNDELARSHKTADDRTLTAVVTGFGGPGGRRGRTNVYLSSGKLSGVILGVLAEELDCKVGDRVPVKRVGNAVAALPGVCRKGASL
jgi:hypothetical protein